MTQFIRNDGTDSLNKLTSLVVHINEIRAKNIYLNDLRLGK